MTQADREHPSTYVVQDRSNEEELIRVKEQDHMFTRCMGGVLAEQTDPTRFQRVLDVGCGSGGWLIETARSYPHISTLVGVDVSGRMSEYASAQAELAHVDDRVRFQTGDALRMLEFPNEFFDLVNQRFGMSFLRKWDWPGVLYEYQRVCRPGGVIRLTEISLVETNSPALTRLFDLLQQAFYHAGNFLTPEKDGIIGHLADLMSKYGIENVQTKRQTISFHTDPQTKLSYRHDLQRAFHTFAPFLRKWAHVPADYDKIYQQMLQEIQQPEFEATQTLLTAWGTRRG